LGIGPHFLLKLFLFQVNYSKIKTVTFLFDHSVVLTNYSVPMICLQLAMPYKY